MEPKGGGSENPYQSSEADLLLHDVDEPSLKDPFERPWYLKSVGWLVASVFAVGVSLMSCVTGIVCLFLSVGPWTNIPIPVWVYNNVLGPLLLVLAIVSTFIFGVMFQRFWLSLAACQDSSEHNS